MKYDDTSAMCCNVGAEHLCKLVFNGEPRRPCTKYKGRERVIYVSVPRMAMRLPPSSQVPLHRRSLDLEKIERRILGLTVNKTPTCSEAGQWRKYSSQSKGNSGKKDPLYVRSWSMAGLFHGPTTRRMWAATLDMTVYCSTNTKHINFCRRLV